MGIIWNKEAMLSQRIFSQITTLVMAFFEAVAYTKEDSAKAGNSVEAGNLENYCHH